MCFRLYSSAFRWVRRVPYQGYTVFIQTCWKVSGYYQEHESAFRNHSPYQGTGWIFEKFSKLPRFMDNDSNCSCFFRDEQLVIILCSPSTWSNKGGPSGPVTPTSWRRIAVHSQSLLLIKDTIVSSEFWKPSRRFCECTLI